MKTLISAGFEVLCNIGALLFVIGGAIGGYGDSYSNHRLMGLVLGGIGGFVGAVIVFGAIFMVMEIRDNTREMVQLQKRYNRD